MLVSFVEVIEWEKLFTEGVGCMIEKTLQTSVFLKEGEEQKVLFTFLHLTPKKDGKIPVFFVYRGPKLV